MEKHLERALIETYFALAEFDQQRAANSWPGNPEDTEALGVALRTARSALEASVRRARDIGAASASKSSA